MSESPVTFADTVSEQADKKLGKPRRASEIKRVQSNHDLQQDTVKKAQTPFEKALAYGALYFGKFLALTYGIFCGMGTTSAVSEFSGSTGLALAAGSITLLVNITMFWLVVPSMLVKLFSPQNSIYDETFEADDEKRRRHIKIKDQNDNIVSVERFSARWWLIAMFSTLFATAASLTYSGLLVSKLKATLAMLIPGVGAGSGMMGGVFLPLAGFLFAVSLICNWAFNFYDSSEQFSRNDFFRTLKQNILKLFLIRPDCNLKLSQDETISNNQLRARQAFRLILLGMFSYLGYYAILSVAHIGTAGVFAFLGAPVIPAVKWILISFSITAASFYYVVASFRFSSFLTRQMVHLGTAYSKVLADKTPALYYLAQATLVLPLAYLISAGLQRIFTAEQSYASAAFNNTKPLPNNPNFFERMTHSASHCMDILEIQQPSNLFPYAWNYIARPTIASFVFLGCFIMNNIHALAMANAVNNGVLAYKAPGPDQSMKFQHLLPIAGGSLGSGQSYVNSVVQKDISNSGDASTTEYERGIDNIKFAELTETYESTQAPYFPSTDKTIKTTCDAAVEADLTRRGIYTPVA